MTTFFTADTHFGHANILKHTDRPWADLDEMHQGVIDQWNDAVSDRDTVYHLGDFAWTTGVGDEILPQLNGSKRIVPGNHDPKPHRLSLWDEVCPPLLTVKVQIGPLPHNGKPTYQRFVLCHYPMLTWDQASRGAIHLHGHSHGNIPQASTRFDVGVDGVPTWHLGWPHGRPVAAEFILDVVDTEGITYDNVDHHVAPTVRSGEDA